MKNGCLVHFGLTKDFDCSDIRNDIGFRVYIHLQMVWITDGRKRQNFSVFIYIY